MRLLTVLFCLLIVSQAQAQEEYYKPSTVPHPKLWTAYVGGNAQVLTKGDILPRARQIYKPSLQAGLSYRLHVHRGWSIEPEISIAANYLEQRLSVDWPGTGLMDAVTIVRGTSARVTVPVLYKIGRLSIGVGPSLEIPITWEIRDLLVHPSTYIQISGGGQEVRYHVYPGLHGYIQIRAGRYILRPEVRRRLAVWRTSSLPTSTIVAINVGYQF